MTVKAAKAKRKHGPTSANGKRKKEREEMDIEAWMTRIESDPNAPLIAKDVVAYWRVRDRSGEPYLTIEQIQAELGRD